MYIQLRNIENDSVVHKAKYKFENGFSAGRIFIDNSIKPGNYYLEAFSKSSFNPKDEDFIANRKVQIVESILNKKRNSPEATNIAISTLENLIAWLI